MLTANRRMSQLIESLKSPSRPAPRVVDHRTGEVFRVITDIEVVVDESGEKVVVDNLNGGERVVDKTPKPKEKGEGKR